MTLDEMIASDPRLAAIFSKTGQSNVVYKTDAQGRGYWDIDPTKRPSSEVAAERVASAYEGLNDPNPVRARMYSSLLDNGVTPEGAGLLTLAADFLPVVGGVNGGIDAYNEGSDAISAFNRGDYGDAAISGGAAALNGLIGVASSLPLVGGVVKHGGGLLADGARFLSEEAGTFGGIKARTADLEALAAAEAMAKGRNSRQKILAETGWFRGPDDQWRFEIPDAASAFDPGTAATMKDGKNVLGQMGLLYDHPELYAAYPELKDISFRSSPTNDGYIGYYMSGYDGRPPEIFARSGNGIDQRSTALHELQHAIQDIEGFAAGGNGTTTVEAELAQNANAQRELFASGKLDDFNVWRNRPDVMRRASSFNDLRKLPAAQEMMRRDPAVQRFFDLIAEERGLRQRGLQEYNHLAGEAEARNVQNRRWYDDVDRYGNTPWDTLDVPEDSLIVRKPDGTLISGLLKRNF